MVLFQCNRLVFGITSDPAIWQRTMNQILEGISGFSCILDGMSVTGKSDAEHVPHQEKVLRRLHHHGLRATKSKGEFFKRRDNFLWQRH
jgi:hypothetical protein